MSGDRTCGCGVLLMIKAEKVTFLFYKIDRNNNDEILYKMYF